MHASLAVPRAFVSFDFDNDGGSRILFIGQGKEKSPTPFRVADWSSKTALPQKTWQQTIEAKIGRCNFVVVLVSPTSHKATGVIKEIAMARRKNTPVFGVYVAGAGVRTKLPVGLTRGRTIPWTWKGIARAIKQVMGEGKNVI
jgi:hypothetical protein